MHETSSWHAYSYALGFLWKNRCDNCLGGYQDRLLGGPLGLLGLCYTAPDGMERKDYGGEVLE
jgi:hypothetical protein